MSSTGNKLTPHTVTAPCTQNQGFHAVCSYNLNETLAAFMAAIQHLMSTIVNVMKWEWKPNSNPYASGPNDRFTYMISDYVVFTLLLPRITQWSHNM